MILAKEEGVPDATGPGATAPHRLLSPNADHHEGPIYQVLEPKGPSGSLAQQPPWSLRAYGKTGACEKRDLGSEF